VLADSASSHPLAGPSKSTRITKSTILERHLNIGIDEDQDEDSDNEDNDRDKDEGVEDEGGDEDRMHLSGPEPEANQPKNAVVGSGLPNSDHVSPMVAAYRFDADWLVSNFERDAAAHAASGRYGVARSTSTRQRLRLLETALRNPTPEPASPNAQQGSESPTGRPSLQFLSECASHVLTAAVDRAGRLRQEQRRQDVARINRVAFGPAGYMLYPPVVAGELSPGIQPLDSPAIPRVFAHGRSPVI